MTNALSANDHSVYVPWWRPVRLVKDREDGNSGFVHLGWVWRQRAVISRNIHYGWLAHLKYQTPELLSITTCPGCGASTNVLPEGFTFFGNW